jgi:hypothetical protein
MALEGRDFECRTNQPVSFDLYSSSFRSGDRCGDVVAVDDSFTPLPPLQTVVQYGRKGSRASIPVHIEADYTEIGTLQLWCRSAVSEHRWRLQFQLRDREKPGGVQDAEVFTEAVVEAVKQRLAAAFSAPQGAKALPALVREVATETGKSKEQWPLSLIRSLTDTLIGHKGARGYGADFESRWLNLVGFFMRPGFGDGFDVHRLRQIWQLYGKGPLHGSNAQVMAEWWILWRRVAGGLTAGQQRQFFQDVTPLLLPRQKTKVRLGQQERIEIWMALASMERLLAKDKASLGRRLLAEVRPKKSKPQLFWALSRLGARQLLYGPDDRVIAPGEVSDWIDALLSRNWRNPKPVAAALAQLGRLTGDRARDVGEAVRWQVIDWLRGSGEFDHWVRVLERAEPLARQEQTFLLGDDLPAGIVLKET